MVWILGSERMLHSDICIPSSSDHPLFYVVVIFFNSGLFLQKFVGLYLFFDPLSSYPLHAFSFPFKKLFTFNNTVNKISFSFYSFFFFISPQLSFFLPFSGSSLSLLSLLPPPLTLLTLRKCIVIEEKVPYGSF